jgi:hypothetical protein
MTNLNFWRLTLEFRVSFGRPESSRKGGSYLLPTGSCCSWMTSRGSEKPRGLNLDAKWTFSMREPLGLFQLPRQAFSIRMRANELKLFN